MPAERGVHQNAAGELVPNEPTSDLSGATSNPPVEPAEAVQEPQVTPQTADQRLTEAGFRRVRGAWRR